MHIRFLEKHIIIINIIVLNNISNTPYHQIFKLQNAPVKFNTTYLKPISTEAGIKNQTRYM